MSWFSDIFVASDADLAAMGVDASNPFGIDLWKMPCQPSVRLPSVNDDGALRRLLCELTNWPDEQVTTAMIPLSNIERSYAVCRFTPQFAEAIATSSSNQTLQQQLIELAREAARSNKHLCWWWVNSELLK
ncbi:MAG: hypothetical protein ABI852_16865 [Gemmatimonadaceae bacterium]